MGTVVKKKKRSLVVVVFLNVENKKEEGTTQEHNSTVLFQFENPSPSARSILFHLCLLMICIY